MLKTFDPVVFSDAENRFILTTLGQPPVVAMRSMPKEVNRAAVKPVIDRIYELIELEKHAGLEWVGVDAIKQAITVWLGESQKWADDKRAGRPRFPSMHSYDSRGRAHRYGPGSDSGQVKTYFTPGGERKAFAIDLIVESVNEWVPEWTAADQPKKGLVVDSEKSRIECSVCGYTETFNKESRGSYNAARARMSKHLRSAKEEVEAHRELHTLEFS